MFMSKEDFEAKIETYYQVHEAVEQLCDAYVTKFGRGGVTHFEVCDPWIDISTEWSTCSCCSPEYEEYRIPVSYLWEDWEAIESEKREAKRLEKEREEAERKAQNAARRERERYEQYLKMKEEFEG